MSMNWIDAIVALGLIWPAVAGFRAGLVSGLLRSLCLVLGGVGGILLVPTVAPWTIQNLGLPPLAAPAASVGFGALLGWTVGRLAAMWWKRATIDNPIGWMDRTGGAVLGLLKGTILVTIFLAALAVVAPRLGIQAELERSGVAHLLKPVEQWLEAGVRQQLRKWGGAK